MTAITLRPYGRLALATALLGITLSAGPADAAYISCPGIGMVQSAAKSFAVASQSHDPAEFAAAVSRYSDVGSLALFALGPYRRELPSDRKAEYISKVRAFIGRFLADHARDFADATLQIQNCADGQIRSVAGGRSIVWRVSGDRVRDVEVDGIWLVNELRSKFVSELDRAHGDMNALFDFLDQNG